MKFSNAKGLAQARRNFVEKVRQASGTGVRIFQRSTSDELQTPSAARGLTFLSLLVLFVAFCVVLTYQTVTERSPLDGFHMMTQFTSMVGNAEDISSRSQLRDYIANVLPTLDLQGQDFNNFMRVGAIRVRQIRTRDACRADSFWRLVSTNSTTPTSCFGDVTSSDTINQTDLIGNRTNITFPYVQDPLLCFGAFCEQTLRSSLLDAVDYPYAGNVYFMDKGRILLENGTVMFSNTSSENSTFWQAVSDDFIVDATRFVQIEMTFYNPSTNQATNALINFECPEIGGVFPVIVVESMTLMDPYDPRCIFLWCYAGIQIILQCYALIQSARHTMGCVTCSQKDTLIVIKCIKCKAPCELKIGRVSLCGTCGSPVPSLRHSCWRSVVTDIWRMSTMLSVATLIASRYATTVTINGVVDLVLNDLELGVGARQTSRMVSLTQLMSIARDGVSLILVTIICTYLRLFHYVCRGQFGSQFARVAEYSLMPLIGFSINFLVAYSGFCFAFYVVGGSTGKNFSTISDTYLTSFRFLLSQIGWSELGTVPPSMLAIMVLFFIVCLCLMFNIFPSVLSVSYKKATRTPYYDVEVLSLWLLLKRYILVPLRIINRDAKRKRFRNRSESATTESDRDDRGSVVDDTSTQLDALRSGAQLEDLLVQQELKALVAASDDVVLRLGDQEEKTKDAVEQLSAAMAELAVVLPRILESYVAFLDKDADANRTAAPHVVEALTETKRIMLANQDRLERLRTYRIALPIIEDTSLLAPIPGPPAPFEDSDDEVELLPVASMVMNSKASFRSSPSFAVPRQASASALVLPVKASFRSSPSFTVPRHSSASTPLIQLEDVDVVASETSEDSNDNSAIGDGERPLLDRHTGPGAPSDFGNDLE